MNWAIPIQYNYHAYDRSWRCPCDGFMHEHPGVLPNVSRHHDPFHQCPPCISNLAQNGYSGAAVVRAMREYTEVPA